MVGLEELKMANDEFMKVVWNALVEGNDIIVKWKNLNDIIARMELAWRKHRCPRYYHTGIEPKRQNRTRKKQRLTRLQRKWKRQKR